MMLLVQTSAAGEFVIPLCFIVKCCANWPTVVVYSLLLYNLYCVGGDVKHCSIQSNPFSRLLKVQPQSDPLQWLLEC